VLGWSTSNWLILSIPSPALGERRALGSSGRWGIRFEPPNQDEGRLHSKPPTLTDCCTPKGYRTIFSEKSARSEGKRYRRKGLDKISRRIAELVKRGGVEGRTVLEVGGGIGAIEIELVTAGATRGGRMSS
jgi:hypothetical protein